MSLRIALAQINSLVGDLEGNAQRMREAARWAADQGAQVIVFPELSLTGYPPEDLLLLPAFVAEVDAWVHRLAGETNEQLLWVIGTVGKDDMGKCYNQAVALGNGQVLVRYAKQALPNYGVFDECRYFVAGTQAQVVCWQGYRLGLFVCEDMWHADVVAQIVSMNADVLLSLNASPYEVGKPAQRIAMLAACAEQTQLPIVYVNAVGGQDGLVFDGQSLCYSQSQVWQLALAQEALALVVYQSGQLLPQTVNQAVWHSGIPLSPSALAFDCAQVWQVLQLGLRDYVHKNGFNQVLLGLSGGIDSALVLALAVDALGADAVYCVMMPFTYTSEQSQMDAAEQARLLGVTYYSLPIHDVYDACMHRLLPVFNGSAADVTEENLQARIRGLLLMAVSNKQGQLLLSTSNKSEAAVGYSTLYGDMNGGFAPLKDVPKTWVYALARWRNQQSVVIPPSVIDRPPSAELRPDQTDQDSLPPYEQLDLWLSARMEQGLSMTDMKQQFPDAPPDQLARSLRLLRLAEYKRRQAAPGIKITTRSFDKDWRMPITQGWKG